jgi:hypothetical protein
VNRLTFLLFSLLLASSLDSMAEMLRCTAERRITDEHLRGASVDVELEKGQLVSLGIESYYAVGRGESGGYSCYINTSETENKSTWAISGSKITLEVTENASSELSRFEIERRDNSFTIIPLKVTAGSCGGPLGKWFKSITVRKGSDKCTVLY